MIRQTHDERDFEPTAAERRKICRVKMNAIGGSVVGTLCVLYVLGGLGIVWHAPWWGWVGLAALAGLSLLGSVEDVILTARAEIWIDHRDLPANDRDGDA